MLYLDEEDMKEQGGNVMEITNIMPPISQGQLMTEIGVSVLNKNLDTVEAMGDSMIKMMEQSVNPNLGANIDVRL